ncbi:MAG TPA: aldehyde ferredoxin oxidoreductase [Candidatus Aerophobetes bacterium]|uniref:Aldehyde ferredoxin oxidoreductase n=1 Tax=Aerophobetes bacterium TaxID=2030807 RepID=A0A7V5HZA3_UNCAE|nr:aldehyde ferredoxin oxidoreductase [Candidatus Aerophobetes bacterium]
MASGYWNKVLRIDLTNKKVVKEDVEDKIFRLFVGGAGFGAKILWEEVSPEKDPLHADNRLIFATGPLQGHPVPGGAKFSVVSKSPLTNTQADSAAGAKWGPFLKKAGYDALIIQGRSETPVYIYIDDDKVEIKDAKSIWGLDSYQAVDQIRKELGDERVSVATIGPAGEKLVRMACIVVDKHSFAGRCGLGAVMGSKNLKAVAVKGSKKVPVANLSLLKEYNRKYFKEIHNASIKSGLRPHGTPVLCITAEGFGDMPIKYWTGDTWPEGAKKIGAPNYTNVLSAKPYPCLYCPIGCHRNINIEEPTKYRLKGIGPEYETLGMLGTNLLIDDVKAIAVANDICNKLGIDTISTGACIGFAMECYEKGIISKKDTGGMEIKWGDPEILIELVKQIGNKEGFGSIFSEGALRAARKIGKNAEELVAHVKGLDFPAHDPRACWGMIPTYATGTRGACHMRGVEEDVEMSGFYIPEIGITKEKAQFFKREGKAFLAVKMQDYCALVNSLVLCVFMPDGGDLSFTSILNIFNSITGWEWDVQEAMKCGERIFTMQRLINLRDGYSKKDDILPPKMHVPAKKGFRAGKVPPVEELINEYYRLREWDENGHPSKRKLQELDLDL